LNNLVRAYSKKVWITRMPKSF